MSTFEQHKLIDSLEKTITKQDEIIDLLKQKVAELQEITNLQQEVIETQKGTIRNSTKMIQILERQLLIQDNALNRQSNEPGNN